MENAEAIELLENGAMHEDEIDFDDRLSVARKMAVEALRAQKIGHWIRTNDYLTTAYGSIDYVKCSCCKEDSLEEGKHCPNCGAKMEEVS